jgi:Tfp pilus assembly ATPase PilU
VNAIVGEALRSADSKNELRLRVKLESRREHRADGDIAGLSLLDEESNRGH